MAKTKRYGKTKSHWRPLAAGEGVDKARMKSGEVHNNNDNNNNHFGSRVPILLFESPFETALSCWHHGRCWRRIGSRSKAAATAQAVLAPRTPMLQHERMTVAMVLAESQHHTSRGQKMARAGEGISRCTARPRSGRISLPRRQAPSTIRWTWMTCLRRRLPA